MIIWFTSLAALGVRGIVMAPEVLPSLDPVLAVRFLALSGWSGFVVLGAVFLAVTGAEALYADVGHFGPRPIRLAWFWLVLPGLFPNYLGSGGSEGRSAGSPARWPSAFAPRLLGDAAEF